MARRHTLSVVLLLAALACNGGGTAAPGNGDGSGNGNGNGDDKAFLHLVASDLDFPVHLTAPPGDPRLFVVEKGGTIRVIRADGTVLPAPFLDLSGEVSNGSEQGLLSLAFHPDYAANGRFFVDYTDRGTSCPASARVSESALSPPRP